MDKQFDLFGDEIDYFKNAKKRYGIWPLTVWEVDMQNPMLRKMKELIGDGGEAREGALQHGQGGGPNSCYSGRHLNVDGTYGYQMGASIFNPAVACWILNLYAPTSGICFDPFAGGGTRGILTAKHGMRYVGVELREEECKATQERFERCGVANTADVVQGDARESPVGNSKADFTLTCPPYWNLERYGGGEKDLSQMGWEDFKRELGRVIWETYRILKPGSLSCWVVGLHREKGELKPIHHEVVRLHQEAGFKLREEIVIHVKNSGAIQRVGSFEKGNKLLVRVHEYGLIFWR